MNSTLKELRKAIKGLVVMSADLEDMFIAFQNNQTPGLWTRVAYPCLKPLASWFKDYIRRVDFFRSWCEKGQPTSFWLPGFYYPQGFMTGALQTHARRYSLPIDQLNFSFIIKSMEGAEDATDAPEDGVYITGLYLEAGRWDRRQKKLKPSHAGEMMSLMPIIHFFPVMDYVANPADYLAPLYKTNLRAGVLNTTGSQCVLALSPLSPAKLALFVPSLRPNFCSRQSDGCLGNLPTRPKHKLHSGCQYPHRRRTAPLVCVCTSLPHSACAASPRSRTRRATNILRYSENYVRLLFRFGCVACAL